MPVEIPKDKWPGKVRKVTLGATCRRRRNTRAKTITVGGEKTLPFMHFDGAAPCPTPVIAVEIKDRAPTTGRQCCSKPGAMPWATTRRTGPQGRRSRRRGPDRCWRSLDRQRR